MDAVYCTLRRVAALSVIAAVAAALAGCETFGSNTSMGKRIDYKSTSSAPAREIPPDLDTPRFDDRFSAPTTASELAAQQSGGRAKQTELLPQNPDARLVRAGTERWLVVKAAPEQAWNTARQFWTDLGFVVAVEQPAIGVMETDFAENRASALAGRWDELPADALNLLGHHPASVRRGDDRPQAFGRRDRLQAGYPGADHKHLRRENGPGCRREHREVLGQFVCRDQHGFVAGDIRHRRQRIHRLRPRDPRNQFQGEQRRAGLSDLANRVRRSQRVAHADDDLAGLEVRQVGPPGLRIGSQATDLQQHVRRAGGFPAGDHPSPFFRVLRVLESGCGTCPRLDHDFGAGLGQRGDIGRHECHAPLAGKGLFENSNFHNAPLRAG